MTIPTKIGLLVSKGATQAPKNLRKNRESTYC